jgi:predicted MFS family arabinose efflux permease
MRAEGFAQNRFVPTKNPARIKPKSSPHPGHQGVIAACLRTYQTLEHAMAAIRTSSPGEDLRQARQQVGGAAISSPAQVGMSVAYRWIILGALFVSRFCLGFQFQSVGSVASFLINDFGLSYTEVGTLVGLYMLPGLIVALPSGLLGKRYGDKPVVMIGLCAMILGGVICATATSYAALSVGRIASGIGATILAVLMNKMLTDWFADKELFIGMSIFIIGWPVGIAAAQATQTQIGQTFGWSAVFYLTAVMLGMALVAMAVFYRPVPTEAQNVSSPSSRPSRSEIWLICIVGWIWMFLNCAYVTLLSFGPALIVERGSSVVQAGHVASLMSWVFFFALPLGGYLATRFKAPNTVMVSGLIGTVFFGLLIPLTDWPHLTFVLFGIAFALATPVIGALPSEALKPASRATGLGLYYVWYYAGVASAPVLGGLLKDAMETAAAPIHFATAMMFACLCLLGLFRLEQSRRKSSDIREGGVGAG